MSNGEPIVAFGLLTQGDLNRLGTSFVRSYPVADTPCFGGLLAELDEADRLVWRTRDRALHGSLAPARTPLVDEA